MRRALVVLSCCAAAIVAVLYLLHVPAPAEPECRFLHSLKVDQARADADAAMRLGDHRLLGVYGFTLMIPGLDPEQRPDASQLRPIECTSDAFSSAEDRRLNDTAREYARRYNEVVLQAIAATRK